MKRTSRGSRLQIQMQNASTLEEVSESLVRRSDGGLTLHGSVKLSVSPFADNPNKVARLLASKLFTVQERIGSNCSGRRGQSQLDPARLEVMKAAIFEVCNIEDAEQDEAWKVIRTSVDSSNRALRYIYNHSKS